MSLFDRKPELLDVTLRDGSYVIDFQFTAADTQRIASGLEAVGFRWIEIGHGFGLNASAAGRGKAAATDEQYMDSVSQVLKTAKWGMFCIPGIARLRDLDTAVAHGMSFVRVGANITEMDTARPFIERARELGLIVSFNAMKSYAVSAEEFGRLAAVAGSWGAEIVCLVDSAGGMFPDDVEAYLTAAGNAMDRSGYLGFHGHDNLSMAMANALRAIDCGAALIDVSLQGMGRSAGNAVAEPLVAILKQRGLLEDIDLNGVMDIGYALISPLLRGRGLDPMAVTSGVSRFHSSFTPKVRRYAEKYGLDARDLVVQLTREDLVDAPDDLLERIGTEMAATRMPRIISIRAFPEAGLPANEPLKRLELLLANLRSQAAKTGKFSVLNVVSAGRPMARMRVSGNIQSTPAHVVTSVTVAGEKQLRQCLEAADGSVDVIFLDFDDRTLGPCGPTALARELVSKSSLLTYSDSRLWVSAVEGQIVRFFNEDLSDKSIIILGDHSMGRELSRILSDRGASVSVAAGLADVGDLLSDAHLIVAWSTASEKLGSERGLRLREATIVLDASMGNALTENDIAELQRRGALLARLSMWPALSGAIEAAHASDRMHREDFGWGEMNGVPVVAGGAVGRSGDIVVDSIRRPTRVIGIADGHGGLLFENIQNDAVRRVNEAINARLVAPKV